MRRNVIVTQSLFTCWSSNVSGRAADQRCVFHSETTLPFYIRVVNTFLVMYVCMYVGLISSEAQARMTVGEALSNLVGN